MIKNLLKTKTFNSRERERASKDVTIYILAGSWNWRPPKPAQYLLTEVFSIEQVLAYRYLVYL